MRSTAFAVTLVALSVTVGLAANCAADTVIGPEARIDADSRQQFARFVRFRPADGQTVALNPPRFSWPYVPQILGKGSALKADQRFTLQISHSPDFAAVKIEVRDTPYNFYNFLPVLEKPRRWYWRVGYNIGSTRARWSDAQSFTIADDAVVWDRSQLGETLKQITGHPRILFNTSTRSKVLSLREQHAFSEELARHMISQANRTLRESWYRRFPLDDKEPLHFMQMGRSLVSCAFAYLLTGDERYAGFKERFLRIASWPRGGFSSPEGAGAADKWETHLTEYLGLFYDWFYDELTPQERSVVRKSLEWRIHHTMNCFAWRRNNGQTMRSGSIALNCSSHPYQNVMATLPGALAICDESDVAREALEVGVHYVIGITNGFGEDEGWNEGPGYGNGKMKWLTDATWYLQTAIPELDLGKNGVYSDYCDFFARITPLGARHCSFGNRGYNERDWSSSRITNFRRVAMLCGDGHAMQNWLDTRRRLKELKGSSAMPYSPWIDYVLPFYATEPEPAVEDRHARLFPIEGWVTVSSAPPSDYDRQKDAVSMTFACRPRGGYSHAFRNENAFDIHAYGETIAVGGGTTANLSPFANHTMSHNTVLVNGREQQAARRKSQPFCGRIIAFKQGDDFVYWAGDATAAYVPEAGLERFVRHVVFVKDAYFVVFDELALTDGQRPGTFQWLYHVTPDVPLDFDRKTFRLRYAIGNTNAVVQHLAHVDDLTFQDRPGIKGMTNPLTGEDLTTMRKRDKPGIKKRTPQPLPAHHVWISHGTPRQKMQFLAVIAPFRQNEPEPRIQPAGALGVRVQFRDQEAVITFDKNAKADIVVDTASICR